MSVFKSSPRGSRWLSHRSISWLAAAGLLRWSCTYSRRALEIIIPRTIVFSASSFPCLRTYSRSSPKMLLPRFRTSPGRSSPTGRASARATTAKRLISAGKASLIAALSAVIPAGPVYFSTSSATPFWSVASSATQAAVRLATAAFSAAATMSSPVFSPLISLNPRMLLSSSISRYGLASSSS